MIVGDFNLRHPKTHLSPLHFLCPDPGPRHEWVDIDAHSEDYSFMGVGARVSVLGAWVPAPGAHVPAPWGGASSFRGGGSSSKGGWFQLQGNPGTGSQKSPFLIVSNVN